MDKPIGARKAVFLSIALVLLYLGVRYPLLPYLDQVGTYASFVFEFVFALAVGFIFRARISFRVRPSVALAMQGLIAIIAGFLIFEMTSPLMLVIPFDLSDTKLVILLLLIGPLIEELIFRMSLWELFQEIFGSPKLTLVFTSLLFSAAHFYSYFSVPDTIQPFILYQTIYTLVLGFALGIKRQSDQSPTSAIILHSLFNLGFYFGYLKLA